MVEKNISSPRNRNRDLPKGLAGNKAEDVIPYEMIVVISKSFCGEHVGF